MERNLNKCSIAFKVNKVQMLYSIGFKSGPHGFCLANLRMKLTVTHLSEYGVEID
jgi:hypothetical protein